MEKLIAEFDVITDSGEVVRLYVYQDIISAGHYGDPHATIPGLKRVVDEYGTGVNVNEDDGSFYLFSKGQTARRT